MNSGPYLQHPGSTHMFICWTADRPAVGTVRFGVGGRMDRELRVRPAELRYPLAFPGWRKTLADVPADQIRLAYVYEARLTGLTPGTRYRYEVRFDDALEAGTFRTLPAGGEPFSFCVYGDNHCGADVHRRVAGRIAREEPLFVIHTGDLITHDHYPEYLRCFFEPAGPLLRNVPVWTARGNHQTGGQCWRELFHPPAEHYYYSFDCGDAHFVCLDSCAWRWPDAEQKLAEQAAWLAADLAATAARWKIVYYHEPSYDMGWRRTDWGREQFCPLLRAGGVDVVFGGHCHAYMRFRPMFRAGQNDGHPITHIVNGGGGGGLTTPRPARPHLAVGRRAHHYVRCELTARRLALQAVAADGRVLDEFAIDKPDGRPSAEYVASAVPEETFANLEYSLRQIKIPVPLAAGETFELPLALFAGSRRTKYDLRLAPGPAKRFRLLRPVRGTIPPGEKLDVLLRVRATVPVRDRHPKSGTRPQFLLECHYEADGFRGMVSSNTANWPL